VGQDDPEIALVMGNLAGLLYLMRRYNEAEHFYRTALVIEKKALGRQDPEIARTLNNLATVCQATARYHEAEDLYREAQNIREAALGSLHPDVGKTLNNLATLEARQGKYQAAEQLYQQAIEVLEGASDQAVGVALANLAQLYLSQKRYSEAEPINLRALAMWEKSLGREHPGLITCLLNQALILRKMKRKTEAAQFQTRAAAIKAKYGSDDLASLTIDVSVLRPTGGRSRHF
jgi:tetratricopeptide (TPR) repeat protein